jgi:hypothetical protein
MAKPRPLEGPWLRIATWICQGHNDIALLRLCARHPRERQQMLGNITKMAELGFIIAQERDAFPPLYVVTMRGRELMP